MNIKLARTVNILLFMSNFAVALGFLMKGDPSQIANPAATSIFYLGLILLERFTVFKLKNYIQILLYITLISHSLFGEYFRAYYETAYFDNALHCFGSFTFALLYYEILISFIKIQSSQPALLTFIIILTIGISTGTIFELIEFFLDLFLNEKNQFGLADTDWDLFFDVIGSFLAGLFMALKELPFFKNLIKITASN